MNIESDFETLIKLCIIGDSSVGKSNFLFKFIEGQFSPLHVATIGFDYKSRIITLPNFKKKVKLQIWDTAGQEKYMSVNKNLFQRVQGVILMYDITSRETFERLNIWLNIIKQMTNDIPIVLVGNKLDLEDNEDDGRIIEYGEGEDFAKENDFDFFEVSAKNGTNVEKAFISIAEKILKIMQDERSISIVKLESDVKKLKQKKKCGC
jgi:small GTP-binding protein